MTDPKEEQDRITELSLETGDIVLKILADSEILNEIPLLSSLYKLRKAVLSIPDILFLRKLERFIRPVNQKTTHDERLKFAEELKRDPKRLEKFYENLLLGIERIDDITKPEILGKIYACHISRKIREEDFHDLCYALSNSKLSDLINFSKSFWLTSYKFGSPKISIRILRSLASSGLVTFDVHKSRQIILGFEDIELESRFQSPFIETDFIEEKSPYTIDFSVTELGYLYAYIVEDLESHFRINDATRIKSYKSVYEFTRIRAKSLRQVIKARWNLSD